MPQLHSLLSGVLQPAFTIQVLDDMHPCECLPEVVLLDLPLHSSRSASFRPFLSKGGIRFPRLGSLPVRRLLSTVQDAKLLVPDLHVNYSWASVQVHGDLLCNFSIFPVG